jgi:hypothetical protein
MTGKPYSRKLNVRFDEGELEIGQRHYASSLLYPKGDVELKDDGVALEQYLRRYR